MADLGAIGEDVTLNLGTGLSGMAVSGLSGIGVQVPPMPYDSFTTTLTLSGTVRDASNALAVRTLRAYRRDTGALLAQTTSAADGTYTLSVPYSGEVQVVCLDDAAGVVENDLIKRATPA